MMNTVLAGCVLVGLLPCCARHVSSDGGCVWVSRSGECLAADSLPRAGRAAIVGNDRPTPDSAHASLEGLLSAVSRQDIRMAAEAVALPFTLSGLGGLSLDGMADCGRFSSTTELDTYVARRTEELDGLLGCLVGYSFIRHTGFGSLVTWKESEVGSNSPIAMWRVADPEHLSGRLVRCGQKAWAHADARIVEFYASDGNGVSVFWLAGIVNKGGVIKVSFICLDEQFEE